MPRLKERTLHSNYRVTRALLRGRAKKEGSDLLQKTIRLLGLLAEPGDEVVAVLLLLETSEGHLCAWDVCLGVEEVSVR